ncbi:hypothetical protein RDWZM_000138 [Blomia tropicalis]|uniref:Neurotransmitter-gated ion-channel ligand-binding domain-containing protein n=1 Tax=Blomia tropicalis TaxID=40697 RepID=A0A9Q0MA95_BLOTA|nr:hypothetical protein RDWZM_000138 [Blomia tropicalis]
MAEHLKGIVDSEYDFDYDEDGELLRLNPEMLYGDEASFKTFIREFYNAISKFITRILMGGFYAYISFMGSKLFFTMSNKTAHMLHCGQFFKNCHTDLDRDKKNNHPWWYIPLIFGDRNDPVIMHYNKFVLINRQLFMSLCILFVIIFQIEMIWCSINIIRYERKCNDSSTIRYHERSNSEQPTNGATKVELNMFVRNIVDVNEIAMQYKSQITFRQKWNDPRLHFNSEALKYVTLTDPERIWIPDTFFPNEISGNFHQMLKPNSMLRIYQNGDILYSLRVTMVFSCPMDMTRYPHDSQECTIRMASYGYTSQSIIYEWKSVNPVQITPNLNLPNGFRLTHYSTDECSSKTNTGTYSCLQLIIDLATFAIFSIQSLTLYGIVHDSIVAFTVFAIFFTILSIGAIVEALSLNIPWTFVLISIAVTASAATLAYDLFKHHRAERLKIQANQLNPYRQFNAEV